jgi:hypothetical protein
VCLAFMYVSIDFANVSNIDNLIKDNILKFEVPNFFLTTTYDVNIISRVCGISRKLQGI